MIEWMIATFASDPANPDFVLLYSDMDTSTLIGCHLAYTRRFVIAITAFLEIPSVADVLHRFLQSGEDQRCGPLQITAALSYIEKTTKATAEGKIDVDCICSTFQSNTWQFVTEDFTSSDAFKTARGFVAAYVPDVFVPAIVAYCMIRLNEIMIVAKKWEKLRDSATKKKTPRVWIEWEDRCLGLWHEVSPVLAKGGLLYEVMRNVLYKASRICIWHVQQKWLEKGRGFFSDQEEWDAMLSDLKDLANKASVVDFHYAWISVLPMKWSSSVPAKKMLKYMRYWMAPERIKLWPMCYRFMLSKRCQDASSNAEGFFNILKYQVWGGFRPSDVRSAFQQLLGGPNCATRTNATCYFASVEVRRQQMLGGANINRIGERLTNRRTQTIALLADWATKINEIVLLDGPRLVYRVPGRRSGTHYIVCLTSDTCTCLSNNRYCKYLLAMRVVAIVHHHLKPFWDDHELDTVYRLDELAPRLLDASTKTPAMIETLSFAPPVSQTSSTSSVCKLRPLRTCSMYDEQLQAALEDLRMASEGLKSIGRNGAMLDASHQQSMSGIVADANKVKASVKRLEGITCGTFPTPQKLTAASRSSSDHSGDPDQQRPRQKRGRKSRAAVQETQRQLENQDEVVQISRSFSSRFQPDQDGAVSLKVTKPKGAAFPPQVPYIVSDHADKDDFVGSMKP